MSRNLDFVHTILWTFCLKSRTGRPAFDLYGRVTCPLTSILWMMWKHELSSNAILEDNKDSPLRTIGTQCQFCRQNNFHRHKINLFRCDNQVKDYLYVTWKLHFSDIMLLYWKSLHKLTIIRKYKYTHLQFYYKLIMSVP